MEGVSMPIKSEAFVYLSTPCSCTRFTIKPAIQVNGKIFLRKEGAGNSMRKGAWLLTSTGDWSAGIIVIVQRCPVLGKLFLLFTQCIASGEAQGDLMVNL